MHRKPISALLGLAFMSGAFAVLSQTISYADGPQWVTPFRGPRGAAMMVPVQCCAYFSNISIKL